MVVTQWQLFIFWYLINMVSNNMRGLQYNMEAFLLPFTLQLCFKYVLWDD